MSNVNEPKQYLKTFEKHLRNQFILHIIDET